ncbi:MAG: hypothetical protein ACYTFW_09415 [Planctomycetota bacterium]|jgi:DNA-directed RNA polymerase subunit RPC12/RpoP
MAAKTRAKAKKIKVGKKEGRVVCPYCKVAALNDNTIIKGSKLGAKFWLLLENDRNNMAVFLCDDCGEMFQLPTSYYIRIVKGE